MNEQPDTLDFKSELASLIPHLRAFAHSLCGDRALADDLAQDAMLRAWKSRDAYQAGTNMKAWTFTILRNQFYSDKRRSWRRQPLDPEVAEATLVASDDSSDAIELLSLRNSLKRLPDDQREVLILVGAGGLPYDEVAEICGCAVGTVKSRVNRARAALADIIATNETSYNSDDAIQASEAFEDLMDQVDELKAPSVV
jgi:RNA polymerase sigma-70 factor (ECF subfamily)